MTSGDDHHETVLVYDAPAGSSGDCRQARTPQHVTFVGHLAHVSSGADGVLRVYSLLDGRLRRTTPLPLGSYNVQAADDLVLTPSLTRGTLCVLDSSGRLETRERVAASSHDVCVVNAA